MILKDGRRVTCMEKVMDQILATDLLIDSLVKLGFALLLGGLIGFEREVRDKAAGFRTMILICTGALYLQCFSWN